ncbi:MAG: hypothetical protein HYX32_08365 [Actinobacteria bacterium]|nr:hypothetical protein [Actinomycetota bacterium]
MTTQIDALTDDAGAGSTGPRPRGLAAVVDRWFGVIATAITTLPFVVGALMMVTKYRDFAPFADIALIELGTRDVGRHAVLLGVYSRFGWRHPGPMLFYLLAIPYWLSGGSSGGLYAGAALINGACVVTIAWLAQRRGGRQLLLLSLLSVALMTRTLGPELWADPWNPSLALYPLLVFLFGSWCLADGDDGVLPILAIAGTFSVQTHVGFAPFIVIPLAVALLSRVILSRTTDAAHPDHRLRQPLLWSVGILTALWLPPLIDQATRRPGNLQALFSFFRGATPQLGLREGVSFTQFELGVRPAWLFGELQAGWLGLVDYSSPPVPIGGVLLLGALGLAASRKDWSGVRIAALALSMLFGSVVAVSRVSEGLFPYVVRWSPAVGLLTWLAVAWIGWRAIRDRLAPTGRHAAGALVAGLLVIVSAANLWAGATTPPHDSDKSATIQALTAKVAPKLDKSKPVVVDTPAPTGGVEALWTLPAVVLQLERQGFDVRVRDDRFTYRAPRGDEQQVVSIHRIAPDAPTVPQLASIEPAAQEGDTIVWVTNR